MNSVSLRRILALAVLLPAATGTPLAAQAPAPGAAALTLEDALRLAEAQSPNVQVARAAVARSQGQQLQARSQHFPQVNASLQYTRTLASQFSALQSAPDTRPNCRAFSPASGSTTTRIDSLEAGLAFATDCRQGGGLDFSSVGFGAKNQYQIGVAGSLNLFTGGRVQAQTAVAAAGARVADIELRAQVAQLALDVTQAYYDAVLADRLLAIADSSLAQTEDVLKQVRLARDVGNQSEFELLRAQVTRDNQIPMRIQRRGDRDLAQLRLKQLLNVPLSKPLTLTTPLQEGGPAPMLLRTALGARVSLGGISDTTPEARSTVRQAEQGLEVQRNMIRAARAERIPALTLSTQYGRVAFPSGGVPGWSDFVSNWTVSVGAQLPLFTGGRIRGDQLVARAAYDEAKARLEQTKQFASLDAHSAITALRQAEAAWAASAGTAEQATRAFTIAQVRYREGISTQVELSESRILLQQAMANRAMAARNLQIARVKMALLKDLPLSAAGGGAGGTQGSSTGTGNP